MFYANSTLQYYYNTSTTLITRRIDSDTLSFFPPRSFDLYRCWYTCRRLWTNLTRDSVWEGWIRYYIFCLYISLLGNSFREMKNSFSFHYNLISVSSFYFRPRSLNLNLRTDIYRQCK